MSVMEGGRGRAVQGGGGVAASRSSSNSKSFVPAQPGSVLLGKYRVEKEVGSGTYGVVYKATNLENGEVVAIKQFDVPPKDDVPITLLRELRLLMALKRKRVELEAGSHETLLHSGALSVVDFKGVTMSESGNDIFMIMGYCEHNLFNLCKVHRGKFTVEHLKYFARELIKGVSFCHSHNILHRDIKGENILVGKDGAVKIADFGLSRMYNPERMTPKVFSRWYRPPELLLGSSVYDQSCDIWALGCYIAELFCHGTPLIRGDNDLDQLEKTYAICGTPDMKDWPEVKSLPNWDSMRPKQLRQCHITECLDRRHRQRSVFQNMEDYVNFKSLICQMVQLNPKKRISADAALDHSFFWDGVAIQLPPPNLLSLETHTALPPPPLPGSMAQNVPQHGRQQQQQKQQQQQQHHSHHSHQSHQGRPSGGAGHRPGAAAPAGHNHQHPQQRQHPATAMKVPPPLPPHEHSRQRSLPPHPPSQGGGSTLPSRRVGGAPGTVPQPPAHSQPSSGSAPSKPPGVPQESHEQQRRGEDSGSSRRPSQPSSAAPRPRTSVATQEVEEGEVVYGLQPEPKSEVAAVPAVSSRTTSSRSLPKSHSAPMGLVPQQTSTAASGGSASTSRHSVGRVSVPNSYHRRSNSGQAPIIPQNASSSGSSSVATNGSGSGTPLAGSAGTRRLASQSSGTDLGPATKRPKT